MSVANSSSRQHLSKSGKWVRCTASVRTCPRIEHRATPNTERNSFLTDIEAQVAQAPMSSKARSPQANGRAPRSAALKVRVKKSSIPAVIVPPSSLDAALPLAYDEYLISPRSSKKQVPVHGAIAQQLNLLAKQDPAFANLRIVSFGYGDDTEERVQIDTGDLHNCDVTVTNMANGKKAVVSVKMPCSNYVQNVKGSLRDLKGESMGLRGGGVSYFAFTLVPLSVPYFDTSGVIHHFESLSNSTVDTYRRLVELNEEKGAASQYPNGIFVALFDTHNEAGMQALRADKTPNARTNAAFKPTQPVSLVPRAAAANRLKLSAENQAFLSDANQLLPFFHEILETTR